jgi:hypothetical protein
MHRDETDLPSFSMNLEVHHTASRLNVTDRQRAHFRPPQPVEKKR